MNFEYLVDPELQGMYNSIEPTELDVMRRLQGKDSIDLLAYELFKLVNADKLEQLAMDRDAHTAYRERMKLVETYPRYAERPEFMDFVRHVVKVESAIARIKADEQAKRKAEEQRAHNRDHACPVCSEVAYENSKAHPCQKCQKVINTKLIHSKERERLVDAWLKKNGGEVVNLLRKL